VSRDDKIEPLPPEGVSWLRGNHPCRLGLSLRECDKDRLSALAARHGVSRTAMGLRVFQVGLVAVDNGAPDD
jgi:hypothetical protein